MNTSLHPYRILRYLAPLLLTLSLLLCFTSTEKTYASKLKTDEVLLFFPTIGSYDTNKGVWKIDVSAWVFEPEEGSSIRNYIIEKFREWFTDDGTSPEIYVPRARSFLVDNERGKEITVRFGNKKFYIGETEENGLVTKQIELSSETVERLLRNSDKPGWISFQAVVPESGRTAPTGKVQLIEPEGTSVISDIDDTIKITEVTNPDREVLLHNVFFKEYEAVEGMAELYNIWKDRGARFHYVSGSPKQLFTFLTKFMISAEFPYGSMHLRNLRMRKDSILKFLSSPGDFKLDTINELVNRFPKRDFILVGDSGERDIEIYSGIFCDYPSRITHIYIRNVTGDELDKSRFEKACNKIPDDNWTVFDNPDKIGERIGLTNNIRR